MKKISFYITLFLLICSNAFSDIIKFQCPNSTLTVNTDKKELRFVNNTNSAIKIFKVKSMDSNSITFSDGGNTYKFNYGGDKKVYLIDPEFKVKSACKKISSSSTLSSSASTTTTDNIENVSTTDQTLIVQLKKNIVNVGLLPNIISSNPNNLVSLNFNDSQKVNEILANNVKVFFVIPKDYVSSSNKVSEFKQISQYLAGKILEPNPERNSIEYRIQESRRRLQQARIDYDINHERSKKICPGGQQITDWMCPAEVYAAIVKRGRAHDDIKKHTRLIETLMARLSSTPYQIEKNDYASYEYMEATISAEKKAIYKILKVENDTYSEKELTIEKKKEFKIANGINPNDKNYQSLKNKYVSINDVNSWQNKKFSDLNHSNLLDKINTEGIFETINKKDLLTNLKTIEEEKSVVTEVKELSWWERLFGSTEDKVDDKVETIETNRFDSVVIVNSDKGHGAGFYISSDEVLTNYHVVENTLSIILEDNKGNKSSAILIKKDLSRDLALLKTNAKGKPVKFFRGKLKQGSVVEALGHPQGLNFSISRGVISSVRKHASTYSATGTPNVLFIQTDAAINPGNSGGPLFQGDKVVGVNTQGLAKSEGLNFAVHFTEVQKFLRK